MDQPNLTSRVDGLFFGKVETRWEGKEPSAIGKTAVSGPQQVGEVGFLGDSQADLKHHGGRDKAIHHYASDHYAAWIQDGAIPDGTVPAAFGENISGFGLTEKDLFIGDILKVGSAVVQVSQGRQPCWKVAQHTGNKKMVALFTKTGRTGWYYRVLEPGTIDVGDSIQLVERLQSEWSVYRTSLGLLLRQVSQSEAQALSRMSELADDWREGFAKIAGV